MFLFFGFGVVCLFLFVMCDVIVLIVFNCVGFVFVGVYEASFLFVFVSVFVFLIYFLLLNLLNMIMEFLFMIVVMFVKFFGVVFVCVNCVYVYVS